MTSSMLIVLGVFLLRNISAIQISKHRFVLWVILSPHFLVIAYFVIDGIYYYLIKEPREFLILKNLVIIAVGILGILDIINYYAIKALEGHLKEIKEKNEH